MKVIWENNWDFGYRLTKVRIVEREDRDRVYLTVETQNGNGYWDVFPSYSKEAFWIMEAAILDIKNNNDKESA